MTLIPGGIVVPTTKFDPEAFGSPELSGEEETIEIGARIILENEWDSETCMDSCMFCVDDVCNFVVDCIIELAKDIFGEGDSREKAT